MRNDHGRKVSGLFGRIAGWYDFLNHFLSLGQDIFWRKRLVTHVQSTENGVILDLAAGTLDVSKEIRKKFPRVRIIGLDFSLPMLLRGKRKMSEKRGFLPLAADAVAVPMPDQCVDCATIAFGIRNIRPRQSAYAEILRVLKPGGRLCILEFGSGKNRVWKGVYNFYLHRILPVVGRVFSGDPGAYSYLARTISEFPGAESLAVEIRKAGFDRVFYYPLCSGIVYIHVAEKLQPAGEKDDDQTDHYGRDPHLAQPA
ncbi:MAG: ubiquinone/menaquinone biosynthesis methyltransferase [Desulfonatronovibrionaceae bacterium]